MKRMIPVIWLLLWSFTQATFAVEPRVKIQAPPSVQEKNLLSISLTGTVSDTPVVLEAAEKPPAAEGTELGFVLFGPAKKPVFALVMPTIPGTYRIAAIATGKAPDSSGKEVSKTAYGFVTVKVTPRKPTPPPIPPPIPPEPPPTPFPPHPFPPNPDPPIPPPTPIPAPGDLRVLLLWETENPVMSRKQESVWHSGSLKAMLDTATVKDSKGFPGWRRYDPDTVITSKEAPEWPQMLEAAKATLSQASAPKLPVIVVFRGTRGTPYPFPETLSELESILKK
jgi:hypothetical protein